MRSGTVKVGLLVALVLLGLLAVFFIKDSDQSDHTRPKLDSPAPISNTRNNLPAEDPPDEALLTFADILNGAEPTFGDAELRQWIRENQNSEAAWLAAFGLRYSLNPNSPWLTGGLKNHPDSLALTMMAASIEVLAVSDSKTASRHWLDRFLKLDPDNGLPWMMSALAEHFRGNLDLSDDHWIRASEASGLRLYTGRFGEAVYELLAAKGYSEAVSTIVGNFSVPVLHLPRLGDVFQEIRSRSEWMREAGLNRDGEILADASYLLGIELFEPEGAEFGLVYSMVGLTLYDRFKDVVTPETLFANVESAARLEDFRVRLKSMRENWFDMSKLSASEYLWWDAVRRNLGELEATAVFAGQ